MPIPNPRPVFLLLLLTGVKFCSAARGQTLQLPVPTSETIPYVAKEMGAATYEETIENDDSVPASSSKRVQRKLVTGIEDINGNSDYTEYQGVMGRPGVDFPVLPSIPQTDFSCRNIKSSGYYADLDTDCQIGFIVHSDASVAFGVSLSQDDNGDLLPVAFASRPLDKQEVFHICDGGRKISFLCPNGTIFRQSHLICDWWFRVDCGRSVELYEESAEQLAADQRVYKERAEAIAKAMQRGSQIERAKAEPSIKSFSTTPPPRDTFRTEQSEFSSFRTGSFNTNSGSTNTQSNRFNSGQNVNYNNNNNQEKKTDTNYQQVQRRRPQNNFNNQQSSGFQGQQNFPQYTNTASIRNYPPANTATFRNNPPANTATFRNNPPANTATFRNNPPANTATFRNNPPANTASFRNNPPQNTVAVRNNPPPPPRQEEERQQLAETASFASNRNRFGNHFFQQNLYKTTQPTPVINNDKINQFSSNNKVYVELNRNRAQPATQFPPITTTLFPQRGPQNQFFDNVASSIYRRPAQQNNFRGNFASSTSPTIVRQNYQPNVAFRAPPQRSQNQFNQNQFVQNNFERNNQQQSFQENIKPTTQRPIFTLKFKPNKSFSYVELHRARTSTPTSAPTTTNGIIPKGSFGSVENNPSPSTVDSTFVSSTRSPLSTQSSTVYSSSTLPVSSVQPKLSVNTTATVTTTNTNFVTQSGNFTSFPTTPSTQTTRGVTVSNIPISSVDVSNYESSPSTTENSVYSTTSLYSTSISSNRSTAGYSSTTEPNTSAASVSNFVTLPSATSEVDITYNVSESKLDDIKQADINSLTKKPTKTRGNVRHGLKIPASSGPKALHSLSLYYATSESDIGATTEYTTTEQATEKVSVSELLLRSHSGSPDSELEIDEAEPTPDSKIATKDLSAVLTKATKDSYNFLFRGSNTTDIPEDEQISEINGEPKNTQFEHSFSFKDHNTNDLDSEQSRGIVQPTTTQITTTLMDDLPDEKKLRDSTDLRELAQVFSRALSAYLEDPDSFRRVLSEVRPTEPTTLGTDSTTLSASEENEDEVLDFSDVSNASPSRTNPTSALDSEDKKNNNGIIDEINSLVYQQKDNLTSDSSVTYPIDTTYQPQSTSVSPTSIAADVNFLLSFSNNTYDGTSNEFSQTSVDNSYFPTAGGVNDGSRPRYGGFHNNSDPESTTHYSPYGSEVAANLTGLPIHETVPTLPTAAASLETAQGLAFQTDKSNSVLENHSAPDRIAEAQDVNALQENQNIYSTLAPSTGHYITSSDVFIKSTPSARQIIEQDLYSPSTDQEKLLIASGSQSIVSKDNYIKFINSKQESAKNIQNVNNYDIDDSNTNNNHDDIEHHLQSSQVTAGSFGSRQRVNHGVTFQSVNLGNGVTIERTKTVRYTTPQDNFWTIPPILKDSKEELTPLSLNNELSSLRDIKTINTEYSETVTPQWFAPESVQATTYHPLVAQPEVNQPAIPPRSSQKSTWQWNSKPNDTVEATTVADETTQVNYLTTIKELEAFPTALADDAQYFSTLLPDINTDTPGFETRAKEMFGNINETAAKTLMDMMNEAEYNMPLRRLILLLVAANGQENRTAEESRSQLVEALLKVPEDNPTAASVVRSTTTIEPTESFRKRTRGSRNRGTPMTYDISSTTPIPKLNSQRSRGSKTYRGTDADTALISTLKRPVDRLQPEADSSPSSQPSDPESDTRAVELLKSLYNLAARWG